MRSARTELQRRAMVRRAPQRAATQTVAGARVVPQTNRKPSAMSPRRVVGLDWPRGRLVVLRCRLAWGNPKRGSGTTPPLPPLPPGSRMRLRLPTRRRLPPPGESRPQPRERRATSFRALAFKIRSLGTSAGTRACRTGAPSANPALARTPITTTSPTDNTSAATRMADSSRASATATWLAMRSLPPVPTIRHPARPAEPAAAWGWPTSRRVEPAGVVDGLASQ